MAIVNQQLTTTQLDMITVPANKSHAITNILVCNNGTSAASFDMHLIPQSPGVANNAVTRVINSLELPAGETFTFDSEKIVLDAGDKISFVAEPQSTEPGAVAGFSCLAATVSYLEV